MNEVAQSCPTLCDPTDCSLPGSSVHGIFQAIVLEWIAISFSRGSSQPRARTRVSRIVDRSFTVWATLNKFKTWVGKIPWRRKWQSTPVLWPGKSHGRRSLVGYSLWGHKESDMTEWLHFTISIRTSNLTIGGICFLIFQLVSEDILDSDDLCGNIIKNQIFTQTRKSLHRGRREIK